MLLNTPIESLPYTSPVTIKKFKALGITSYWNLLNYFPFRYENYSLTSPIIKLQLGETATIKGEIVKFDHVFTKSKLKIQKAVVKDKTGQIEVVWYNQFYLYRVIRQGMNISLAGEVKGFFNKFSFEPKEYEILKEPFSPTIHTGRLVPIYSEKYGLSSKLFREKIYLILNLLDQNRSMDGIAESLPSDIISFNNLLSAAKAFQEIHFPSSLDNAKKARERLGFDELFTIQLAAQFVRKEWDKENVTNPFELNDEKNIKLGKFIAKLPFELTGSQKKVVADIISDLKRERPMNRFLEGDVGSGKTVVAAVACYIAYLNGFQSLIMAPTEILAIQHYNTINRLFQQYKLKVGLQTHSIKQIAKSSKSAKTKKKDFDILIGTHALITKKLKFEKVGLVVIDEQHRFGVVQRAELKSKGLNPHLLTMTATPIPRTVALTLYGELDLSVIDEMPKGRLPIKTFLVPSEKRTPGYEWVKKQIKENGDQVFIICPLIEESEVETMKSIRAATKEFQVLKNEIFKEFRLGLLHGKIKPREKDTIMQDFKEKKLDILVATSVVEVGIDVPNATIMMIEGADRFGLAQLHQLRGRVGRGEKQSYCLLYTESTSENTVKRLNLFCRTQNGMQVAEYDLKLRGPGEIFGSRQHGYKDLKIASLSDYDLISKTKQAVNYFMTKYSVNEFPEIQRRLNEFQTKQISRD